MRVGRFYLECRSKYRHGLRVAYYRDIVARRILTTPPVTRTDDDRAEVHILMWKEDWLEGIWTLKSLYRNGGIRYRLCIHEDGSLGTEEMGHLRGHFPTARIIDRPTADGIMEDRLAGLPLSSQFRRSNPMALKVLDFHTFLQSDRIFLTDSDVLFFSPPTELLRRVSDSSYRRNTLNRDWRYGYSVDLSAVRPLLEFDVPELINSGLGLLHRGSLCLSWVERFLALPGMLSHAHRIEQTLIALCSARYGFDMLPTEYDVHTGGSLANHSCRHYTGPIRHLFYGEGIPRLLKHGFLSSRRPLKKGSEGRPE